MLPPLFATETGVPLEAVAPAPVGSAIDFAWLIPVIPAVSAGLLLLFGKRLGALSGWLAVLAVGASATISTLVFAQLAAQPAAERTFVRTLFPWISAGELQVDWALLIDPLSSVMLLLVTWVGLLIHIYSLGYMHGDELYARYFAYLNLFVASMLVLVLGESFLTLFVGWELVGLCSYLLIGHWFASRGNASAAKKAFIVNRIGDVGFMIAMFVIFAAFGSLSFGTVLPGAGSVLTGTTAAAIALLLFVAATGKSAQIPLFVWLPDAMAGPTPVSALIHAATMVTAGVYLVARTSPIFGLVPDIGLIVASVGVITALVTAIIACAQTDLKRILAYSTVSQLGYMFVGVGVGDYTAGIFHLLTHGGFKALLFLAAGSAMHALGNETDVRRMGGLGRVMPVTAVTSALAVLAISSFPFFSGFYSKEEILVSAAEVGGVGTAIWVVGIITAGLTAFYMARWFVLIFLGPPRWGEGEHPHESPLAMTLPLAVLAIPTVIGGVLNLNPETGFLHGWLVGPSVLAFDAEASIIPESVLTIVAVAVALFGLAAAFAMYLRVDIRTVGAGNGARLAARRGFWVDQFYETVVYRPGRALAVFDAWFDANVVDGAVNGLARLVGGLAGVGRRVQTGFVRTYALAVLAGAVLLTVLLLGNGLGLGVG
jgi:NADH-quinone oxidoreductase subunit L